MKKTTVIILIISVFVLLAGYFIYASFSYVAKVGSAKIENHEYIFFLIAQKINTESEAGAIDEYRKKELWKNPADGEDPISVVMNQALENAKEFKIQLIKANEAKFKLSEQERKDIRAYLDDTLKNQSNIAYVKNDLGLTLTQFKDIVWKSELAGSFAYDLMEKNSDNFPVTDDEAKAFYDENKAYIDEVALRRLIIPTEGLTEEQINEKKKLAEDLLSKIKSGEDMIALIKEHSEDTCYVDEGLYTFTYDEDIFEIEVKDWAFSVEPGESGIVQVQSGIYVLRLENKKGFEDKKAQIISSLKSEKLNVFYYKQLEEWKNDPEFNLIKNENVLNRITNKVFSK